MTLFKPRVGKVIFAQTTSSLCVVTPNFNYFIVCIKGVQNKFLPRAIVNIDTKSMSIGKYKKMFILHSQNLLYLFYYSILQPTQHSSFYFYYNSLK